MPPLVSVVVPVFNGLPYLRPLLESLLGQTYRNLEIILSEGGGSDESDSYLKGLSDSRIRILRQPQGTSAARNWTAASEAASGEYTKLICQDDLLYPDAIAHQVNDLRSNPTAVMAVGRRDIVDAEGRIIFRKRGLAGIRASLVPGEAAIRQCYLRGTNVFGEPLAVLFRTDQLHQALPWIDGNPLMLDLTMYEKVAAKGDVVLRWEAVGAFRVSTSSWSTSLAHRQVEQTRQWQKAYERRNSQEIRGIDRLRAAIGRQTQPNIRRVAYWVLDARGRLTTPSAPIR